MFNCITSVPGVSLVFNCVARLLAGAPSALKKTLGLDKPPRGFSYLNPLSLKSVGVDDTSDFKSLVQSMKSVSKQTCKQY